MELKIVEKEADNLVFEKEQKPKRETPKTYLEPLLMQGDSLELLSQIKDQSIDAIITDPPYFLGITHNGKKGCFNDLAIAKPFFQNLFKEYKRIIKPKGCIYFFTDWRGYAFYYPIFDNILQAKNLLVWEKQGRPTPSFYGFGHELIIFTGEIKKSYVSNIISGITSFNHFSKKQLLENDTKQHPTQKPLHLMERLILDSTNKGDVVLDTFMGSGSTGVACIKNKRRFIGIEIDDTYFEIATNRINAKIEETKQVHSLFEDEEAV